jgi:hypothetical protein
MAHNFVALLRESRNESVNKINRVRSTQYWLAVPLAGRVERRDPFLSAARASDAPGRALQADRLTESECFARDLTVRSTNPAFVHVTRSRLVAEGLRTMQKKGQKPILRNGF